MVYLILQGWRFLQSMAEWTRWPMTTRWKLSMLPALLLLTVSPGEARVTFSECSAPPLPQLSDTARAFSMGFTRWPPEASVAGLERMNQFIAQHGDLTALHFDGGVPWPEALQNDRFPDGVMNEWHGARASIPKNHARLVSITPLNWERNSLALYWGSATNQPLPSPWNDFRLDHPDVKTAYLNYARRVVEYFHPDYLAIGIEVNVAQANAPEVWDAYKELHRYVYKRLKHEYPQLPIFASFTNSHLNGLDGGNKAAQASEIETILPYLDLIGLSVYPYGWAYESGKVYPFPDDFFQSAISFGKPIGVTESGAPSQSFTALGKNYAFSEDYQGEWIGFLLQKANVYHFAFVVNWAAIDFDRLLPSIPSGPQREFALFWAYTGLERSDGCPKQALGLWDSYLHLPHQP